MGLAGTRNVLPGAQECAAQPNGPLGNMKLSIRQIILAGYSLAGISFLVVGATFYRNLSTMVETPSEPGDRRFGVGLAEAIEQGPEWAPSTISCPYHASACDSLARTPVASVPRGLATAS